jgi:hypothetical protein
MAPGTTLWLVAAVGLVLALGLGWPRRKRRRNGLRAVAGVGLLAVAAAAATGGVLLREYRWLREGEPVARIGLHQQGSQSFVAALQSTGRPPARLPLHGDEWQLEARVVRWQVPPLPPLVRLERLSGVYGDPKQQAATPGDRHDLRARWDFWQVREHALGRWPVAQARWGTLAPMPMLDGTTYDVFVDARGVLVAKPADAATVRRLHEAGW